MRLLLVEDEQEMAKSLGRILTKEGYVVDHSPDIEHAREAFSGAVHDLILLDRYLPDGDGLDLLKELRRTNEKLPILLLTARDAPVDRIDGLDAGADDYILKPFDAGELSARIRAAARRSGEVCGREVRHGNVSICLETLEVNVLGEPLMVPRRELLLLKTLMRRAGRTVLRQSLEESIYGFDEDLQSNALDSHVSRLRRRLADARADITIRTVRGVGYILRSIR